jgi:hypothetical protein
MHTQVKEGDMFCFPPRSVVAEPPIVIQARAPPLALNPKRTVRVALLWRASPSAGSRDPACCLALAYLALCGLFGPCVSSRSGVSRPLRAFWTLRVVALSRISPSAGFLDPACRRALAHLALCGLTLYQTLRVW